MYNIFWCSVTSCLHHVVYLKMFLVLVAKKKMMHLKHHLGFPTVSPTFKPVDPEAHMKLTASEFKAGKKKKKIIM